MHVAHCHEDAVVFWSRLLRYPLTPVNTSFCGLLGSLLAKGNHNFNVSKPDTNICLAIQSRVLKLSR